MATHSINLVSIVLVFTIFNTLFVESSFPCKIHLPTVATTTVNGISFLNATTRFYRKLTSFDIIFNFIRKDVEMSLSEVNISLHTVVFTSIVAFFWCFTKVALSFVESIKNERRLKAINSQVQRKIYFFETEIEQLKVETTEAKHKLEQYTVALAFCETTKCNLKLENGKLKEVIKSLQNKAGKVLPLMGELESARKHQKVVDSEITGLEIRIKQLTEKTTSDEEMIINLKQSNKTLDEKVQRLFLRIGVKNLRESKSKLAKENEALSERLAESELNLQYVQTENRQLKCQQNDLSGELQNLKNQLLEAQENAVQLKEANFLNSKSLKAALARNVFVEEQLEMKTTEASLKQTLLELLNKRMATMERCQENGDEPGGCREIQDVVILQLRIIDIELEKRRFETENLSLKSQLESVRSRLETVNSANESLTEEAKNASTERLKAVAELEVMSKLFKERELQYGVEIAVQRVKREQTEEDETSMATRLATIQEENEGLREQVKSFRRHLDEGERRHASEVNFLEKQSHENWIAARMANRKYEETFAEATALRQRLAFSATSQTPSPTDFSTSFPLDESTGSMGSRAGGLNGSLLIPPPPPMPLTFPF